MNVKQKFSLGCHCEAFSAEAISCMAQRRLRQRRALLRKERSSK